MSILNGLCVLAQLKHFPRGTIEVCSTPPPKAHARSKKMPSRSRRLVLTVELGLLIEPVGP